MFLRATVSAIVLSSLGACEPVNSPWMFPGQNCISCHNANGQAFKNPWTVGGTVFNSNGTTGVEGVYVVIKDARGQVVTLTTNGVGNFYTAEEVDTPYQGVWVGTPDGGYSAMPMQTAMAVGTVNGGCNYCHNSEGAAGVPVLFLGQ